MSVRSEVNGLARWAERLPGLIAGDSTVWRAAAAVEPDVVIRLAIDHGMLPLVAAHRPRNLPWALEESLRREALIAAARDLLSSAALREVLEGWHGAGVLALLMKGVDLAHTIYERSDLRPRLDTDVLVAEAQRDRAVGVLQRLGYTAAPQVHGDLLMYQEPYTLSRDGLIVHTVDLHWRVANPQRFGQVLAFGELWASSEPRPSVGPFARGLSRPHALLLACTHRIAHHYDEPRLIWCYDIHGLGQRLDQEEWGVFGDLAVRRHAAWACLRGLQLSMAVFGTPVPAHLLQRLEDAASREAGSTAYARGQRHVQRIAADFRALPSWTDRIRLARQHLFPSARYMRDVYAPDSRRPLVWLYTTRVWRGVRRWVARS